MEKTPKTSIIVTACNMNRLQTQITSACLGNISRYTDREEYELIFVDQYEGRGPQDLNPRHNFIDIDKHLKIYGNIGMSAAMNLGYKNSNTEYPYICFMHNDVFVQEGWLSTLRKYVENGYIIMPHQGPSKRQDIKNFYQEENPRGNDDAGLVMMSKEMFIKTGGWDERFKGVFQDAAFRVRFPKGYWCTGKCLITHIGSINMYDSDQYHEEDVIWEKLKNYNEGLKVNYL